MIIQIVLILFFVFALFKTVLRFKVREISLSQFIFWIIFWICAGIVVYRPNLTATLAKFLGVGRGVDAILYLAIAGLFFIIFRIWVRLDKMEKNITRLVRQDALDNKNK